MAIPGFLFGGDTGLTQDQLAKRRQVLEAMLARGVGAPRNVGEGLTALGEALAYRMEKNALAKGEEAAKGRRSSVMDSILGAGASAPSSIDPSVSAVGGGTSVDMAGEPIDMSGNDIYSGFMGTVKAGGVDNPYALAAIAATGKAESGFSPKNVNRSWSDPSQSGQPGTAGGLMSWRGPRLDNLYAFARENGEQPGSISPATQAKFFLQEDPQLVERLKGAKSVEEAQRLMNNAWAFAGYDQPGGEAANRLSAANAFLPTFQGQNQPAEVASLDPSIGMPVTAAGAIEQVSPIAGQPSSLTDEVNDFKQTPEYAAQFPGRLAVAKAVEGKGISVGAQPQFSPAVQHVGEAVLAKNQPVTTPQAAQPVQTAQAASSGPSLQQLYTAAASPDITDQDRAVVNTLIEQKLVEQRAARDQETWMQRQNYEAQQQRNDPLYQQRLQAGQLDLEAAQNGQWARLDDGRLYNQRTGEVKDAPGTNGNSGETFFGNPIAIQTPEGIKYGQIGNKGGFKEISIGEGNKFAPPTRTVDTETEQVIFDNFGNEVGRIPKQNREKARETAIGKSEGESAASLPTDLATAAQTVKDVDALIDHPGLSSVFGSFDQFRPAFTMGSAGKDALARYNQIKGKVFLQGFAMLKGGGQITEVEGAKAEQAAARLDRAQDEATAKAALTDFRDAVQEGARKLREKAGIAAPEPAANVDDLLKKYGGQ